MINRYVIPSKERIDEVFNAEMFLAAVKSKIREGDGISPEDMTSLARIVFEKGIKLGIAYCEYGRLREEDLL